MNNVKREINILRKIDHKNIIKLVYALEDKRQVINNINGLYFIMTKD